MNQKPSERILEIANQKYRAGNQNDCDFRACTLYSLIDYLDEVWEQNQPCKHEWSTVTSDVQIPYCRICKKLQK